jgi:uncharacterized coiled-coil protein SlyX
MRPVRNAILICSLLGPAAVVGHTQTATPQISAGSAIRADAQLEQKIDALSSALAATQRQIEQSQQQMQQLQQQMLELRQQMASAGSASPASPSVPTNQANSGEVASTSSYADTIAAIEERQQTTEAAVRLHDQTKVESGSKYPVRLTGLILFNGFLNRGVPDNTDLPEVALRGTSTSGSGDLGASMRQTIIGVEGEGPRIAGAHTSANVSLDFFSSVSYNSYGTAAGVARMRTGSIDFDWTNNSLQVGMVAPLISPRSPDSFATVAEPSLAGAGNLWAWAPELRYTHRFSMEGGDRLQFEFGLWDPPAAGYNPNQLFRTPSPGELAGQPAYETRVSYGSAGERGLQVGLGGYYSRQAYPGYQGYPGTENLDGWAGTADWRLPLGRWFEIEGEGYRGRSIAGLGGGAYKDIVAGTSPITGAPVLQPLNAIGGWTQFKTRFNSSLQSNFSIGQDTGFASDFHDVVIPPTATATQLRARNRMVVANLIYRPKTYIILSPEYRRIWSWPINSPVSTLNIYTLSIGYQF